MTIDRRNFIKLAQKASAPFFAVVVIGYFIYHSLQGDRGILAWIRLREHLHDKQQELAEQVGIRERLETKIKCLRPESLDRDLLDQQVRLHLGYTHPQDVVVLTLDQTPPAETPQ